MLDFFRSADRVDTNLQLQLRGKSDKPILGSFRTPELAILFS